MVRASSEVLAALLLIAVALSVGAGIYHYAASRVAMRASETAEEANLLAAVESIRMSYVYSGSYIVVVFEAVNPARVYVASNSSFAATVITSPNQTSPPYTLLSNTTTINGRTLYALDPAQLYVEHSLVLILPAGLTYEYGVAAPKVGGYGWKYQPIGTIP